MNIENMEKVIAALEAAPDKKFNMGDWIIDKKAPIDAKRLEVQAKALTEFEERRCGTSACVAGWTVITLLAPENRLPGLPEDKWVSVERNIRDTAQQLLGLGDFQMQRLFYGEFARKPIGEITRADAVAEMRRMVAVERAKP